jgi:hypothetical protein
LDHLWAIIVVNPAIIGHRIAETFPSFRDS